MATITLRSVKGSPLTNNEIDGNFTNLNNDIATRLLASSYTASDVLTKLLTVDGTGSGIDADLLDGLNTSSSDTSGNSVVTRSSGNFSAGTITATLINAGLYVGTTQNITFEGSSDDAYETTLTVVDPTADRTITFPNVTGTVVTTGDTGSITDTMLAGSISVTKLTSSNISIDGTAYYLGQSYTPAWGKLAGTNTWTGVQTFRDNKFVITDDLDTTKVLNLQLSNITTGQTRTLTIPDASGTVALQSYVTGYVQTTGQNSQGNKTISTSTPTGGAAGDIWYRV